MTGENQDGSRPGADWEEIRAAALRRAAALEAMFSGHQVVVEAELALRGLIPVTVIHGDAEDQEAADLIYRGLPAPADECGPQAGNRGGGGNDYTTSLFADADAAARFAAGAREMCPSWWRATETAHSVWRADLPGQRGPQHRPACSSAARGAPRPILIPRTGAPAACRTVPGGGAHAAAQQFPEDRLVVRAAVPAQPQERAALPARRRGGICGQGGLERAAQHLPAAAVPGTERARVRVRRPLE